MNHILYRMIHKWMWFMNSDGKGLKLIVGGDSIDTNILHNLYTDHCLVTSHTNSPLAIHTN